MKKVISLHSILILIYTCKGAQLRYYKRTPTSLRVSKRVEDAISLCPVTLYGNGALRKPSCR